MRRSAIGTVAALVLAGASVPALGQIAADRSAPCANWQSPESVPGREWWTSNRWRYRSDETAKAAYAALTGDSPSPWPDWFVPKPEELAVGTRFKMAIGAYQSPAQPGGFGTFDDIVHVEDIRTGLAVKQAWKPLVDRVVTYEVIRTLPAHVGPIGPQLDDRTCRLLPGRWSQIEMLVPREKRMRYLRIVSIALFAPIDPPGGRR
jgi:hypothetical protein